MSAARSRDKEKAIALRAQGKSYAEIRRALGIRSKGTLSAWLRSVSLSPSAEKRLARHASAARIRNFAAFNKSRSARIDSKNQTAWAKGTDAVGTILTRRELALVGAALYWGEGTKSSRSRKELLSFANSDPKMIALFMLFIQTILEVPENRIRAGMHIYANTGESVAREYWANVTGLPKERFYVVRQVSRASAQVRPVRSLPYGTAVIRVNDPSLFFCLSGMMHGLANVSLSEIKFVM